MSAALLVAVMQITHAQSTQAQSGKRKVAPPSSYQSVIEALRSAKQKVAADRHDVDPLLQILQGASYPQALQEASQQNDDVALTELYQAKYSEQWPRTVPGTTLLSYAARNDDAEVVRRLLTRGKDVNAVNEEGWTALHNAAESGNATIIKMLLDTGANVNAPTARFGETPLMLACGLYGGKNSLACAKLLLAQGARVNVQTKDGETSLMFAARRGLVDTVQLLLSKNADASLTDFKGKTALSQVIEFTRIDASGEITYSQDSTSVPTYKLKVFDALIRHGKVQPGLYASAEVEHQVEQNALNDFLKIVRLLQKAGRRMEITGGSARRALQNTGVPLIQSTPRGSGVEEDDLASLRNRARRPEIEGGKEQAQNRQK